MRSSAHLVHATALVSSLVIFAHNFVAYARALGQPHI